MMRDSAHTTGVLFVCKDTRRTNSINQLQTLVQKKICGALAERHYVFGPTQSLAADQRYRRGVAICRNKEV